MTVARDTLGAGVRKGAELAARQSYGTTRAISLFIAASNAL